MKVTCPHCENVWLVPKDYAGMTVKCPNCKNPVHISEPTRQPITRFVLTAVISAALAGLVGFTCGVLITKSNKQKVESTIAAVRVEAEQVRKTALEGAHEVSAETAQLRNEVEQLQTQARQLRREIQEAWAAKQKAERELDKIKQLEGKQTSVADLPRTNKRKSSRKITCREWQELGFPGFCDIPAKGKVPETLVQAVGDYGRPNSVKIIQILGPYEMLVELETLYSIGTHAFSNKQLVRLKGYTTQGLVDGQTWSGRNWQGDLSKVVHGNGKVQYVTPEVTIIGTWRYTTAMGAQKTVFTAIPLDFVREGLTEEQFQELLK